MPKKFGRKGNKEGSIYNTIQKIDRKEKRLNFVCNTCKNCNDWSICNNRSGTNKCKKCTDCTACLKKGTCDRFYCYNRYTAQITLDDGSRTTVSNANSRVESIERKKEVEAQIQTKTYIKKNGITIIEILKKIGDTKFEAGKIIKNTKDKDEYHYKYIEKWDDFKQPVQKVTYNQVQNFLNSIRHLSQGEIDKIIAKLKNGFMQCVMDKIISYPDNPMLRIYPPVSNQHKEPVQAFEVDEQQKLMDYLLHNSLIKSSKCNYNETTLRNLFLCALLSAARIGELGAINFNTDIDLKNRELIINKTLSRDDGKIVMGTSTKTGRKKTQQGLIDERHIPFDIFDSDFMFKIITNQIENAKLNPNNKNNLLFCQLNGNYIDTRCINNIFKRICREAQIKTELIKGCHIHMCRHTATTRMLEAGMDLLVIAAILGHSDDRQIKETYGHILARYRNKQLQDCRNYYKEQHLHFDYTIPNDLV